MKTLHRWYPARKHWIDHPFPCSQIFWYHVCHFLFGFLFGSLSLWSGILFISFLFDMSVLSLSLNFCKTGVGGFKGSSRCCKKKISLISQDLYFHRMIRSDTLRMDMVFFSFQQNSFKTAVWEKDSFYFSKIRYGNDEIKTALILFLWMRSEDSHQSGGYISLLQSAKFDYQIGASRDCSK